MYNVLKTVRVKCPFLDKLLKMMRLSGERRGFKGDAKCAAGTKSFRLGGDCLRSQTFLSKNQEFTFGLV